MKPSFLCLLLLLCFKSFGQFTDPENIKVGKYYALLIAVKDYQHPMTTDLDYPIVDAEKLKNALQKYQFDEIQLVKNPSRSELFGAFDKLQAQVKKNDNVLIFYSGHGFWDAKIKNGYWLPTDAEQSNRSNWVSNSDIKDRISGIESQHTLLIVDACFSGGIFKSKEAFEGTNKSIKDLYKYPSRKGMTSGALTTVPDHSQFLEFLVKRLDQNTENYLPVGTLFYSFREAVSNNSPNVPQYGIIQDANDEGGEFVFIRKTDSKAIEEAKSQEALQKEQELAKADETAWTKAKQLNTILSYETYLNTYANGKYRYDAQNAKTKIETAEKAESERLAAEARKREQNQADETAWVKAKNANTIEAYQTYLNTYANGKYAFEAQMGKTALENAKKSPPLGEGAGGGVKDLPTEETFYIDGVQFEMVYVEGGTFQMGSNELNNEKPIHTVTLDGFWIGKTEVTQAQWKAVMGTNPSNWKEDNLPVENVTWNDCQEYITKLNAKTGKKYSLPTEAQWEYAARGGKKSTNYKYAGSNNLDEVACYGSNSGSKTQAVGTKKANELGLYDMSGNVWEWCADGYKGNFYETAKARMRNPVNNSAKEEFVFRGGSWVSFPDNCRVSYRGYINPTYWYDYDGFRFSQVR